MKLFIPQFSWYTNDDVHIISFCFKLWQAQSYRFTIEEFKGNNKNRFEFLVLYIQIGKLEMFIEFPYKRLKDNE